MTIKRFLTLYIILVSLAVSAQNATDSTFSRVPHINGTLRARFEYQPEEENSRFQVRNARVSVTGDIFPQFGYKAEVDLCDEGKIKMLDAYLRYKPARWSLTAGQMRVPFTIDAHRGPNTQYFANRSFLAKTVGNVRDVGLAASFTLMPKYKWIVEGGIFNGSGLTDQKDYWTSSYNFSAKTYATFADVFTVEFSCQKIRPKATSIMLWDAGAYFNNSTWHLEAEYLRKVYTHGKFPAVNTVDAFVVRKFPVKYQWLTGISALARYDYMSNHSTGVPDADTGLLFTNHPQRQRITAGGTLHFAYKPVYFDIRLNYEQYFYRTGTPIAPSDHSKLVIELMARF